MAQGSSRQGTDWGHVGSHCALREGRPSLHVGLVRVGDGSQGRLTPTLARLCPPRHRAHSSSGTALFFGAQMYKWPFSLHSCTREGLHGHARLLTNMLLYDNPDYDICSGPTAGETWRKFSRRKENCSPDCSYSFCIFKIVKRGPSAVSSGP